MIAALTKDNPAWVIAALTEDGSAGVTSAKDEDPAELAAEVTAKVAEESLPGARWTLMNHWG